MHDFPEEQTTESTSQDSFAIELVHIETTAELPGDGKNLHLSEAYMPCEGTWKEFVGDVKRTISKMKAGLHEQREDIRESAQRIFHRRHKDSLESTKSRPIVH